MIRNQNNKFFPPPSFLVPPAFGLDISDDSLRFVEIISTRQGIKIGKFGKENIPVGVVKEGRIKDAKQFEEILSSLRINEEIKAVRIALPEEQTYLFKVRLEKDGLKDVREGIELSLEEYVPIPAQDAIFDYELLSEDTKILEAQVTVMPRYIIESYTASFKNCGISVLSFEPQSQAITRSVIKKGDMDTYMIIDFGQNNTGVYIVSKGMVMFTSTLDIGGSMLTKTIQKNFKITFEEAEKMKIQYGILRNAANKEMFSVLLNSLSVLSDEIAKHFLYWHTHKDENEKERPSIKKIILCGTDSNLAGLSEYFSINLKHPVELADVWVNLIEDTGVDVPVITFKQSLSFASALGLALVDFYHD